MNKDQNPMSNPQFRGAAGLALLLLCTANFLDAMDVSTIGVALPAIQAELGMRPTSLQCSMLAVSIEWPRRQLTRAAGFPLSSLRLWPS